jgi:biotin synthase
MDKKEIVSLLNLKLDEVEENLFSKSRAVKLENVSNLVYFRGLIEFSNICEKDCYYCGIRKSNLKSNRYLLDEKEILDAAIFAWKNQYASIVLQAGESSKANYIDFVTNILKKIMNATNNELRVTLSCGEQEKKVYKKWYEVGARRYLLRIETSNKALYKKIHPNNKKHSFENRLECLKLLKKLDYQLGSGIMIGLPFQSIEDIADDLLFLKNIDVDMVGMGPYIEHINTPLYKYKKNLLSKEERFFLTLKAIAILRLLMPDINIASSTALQAIYNDGREKAIDIGANVIMPSLTPISVKSSYLLYEGKPCLDEDASKCKKCLENRVKKYNNKIAYGVWGDSKHYKS